jgi:hypothetical protein
MVRSLLLEFRFAVRQLLHHIGFTLVAVLTLALAIAANSTIFSWISSTLLDPVPGASGISRMVTVARGPRSEHPSPPFSYPDYVDLRDNARSLSGLLAWHNDYMSLTGVGKPSTAPSFPPATLTFSASALASGDSSSPTPPPKGPARLKSFSITICGATTSPPTPPSLAAPSRSTCILILSSASRPKAFTDA